MNTHLILILVLLNPLALSGIRRMIVDAQGQLGYLGSQNSRLGRVR